MAGELAGDNAAHLADVLGHAPEPVDLYLAHFLGADGARKFLTAWQTDPQQAAAPVQVWVLGRLPELGLALDGATRRRLERAGFARYAGRLYPDADEPDLRTLAILFTWFFLVDDACDGPGRLAPERIRALRAGAAADQRRRATVFAAHDQQDA